MEAVKKLVDVGIALTLMILAEGCLSEPRKTFDEMQLSASCKLCQSLDGFVPPSQINDLVRRMVGKFNGKGNRKITRKSRRKGKRRVKVSTGNVAIQEARGVTETYLEPNFIDGGDCPEIDSEKWAIDYSYKRGRPALHKGIDIPETRGTPIRAISAGVVVGKFLNEFNKKGIEIMLRHTPDQTGLPFWTYSQYTHLQRMSQLTIRTKVKMGDEIGKTANTGVMGRRIRRDALHFAVLYSKRPEWSNDGVVVMPKDGYFMDPNAFYRLEPPYDSRSLANLPSNQKQVPIPWMKADGTLVPSNTRRIWPYVCKNA